jgi:hypothetical protein
VEIRKNQMTEFRVSGGHRYDKIQRKINAGKKITMEESQVMNLHNCSALRDKFFPLFCKKQGLPANIKLTHLLWSGIWEACVAQYILETRGEVMVTKAVIVRQYEKVPKNGKS